LNRFLDYPFDCAQGFGLLRAKGCAPLGMTIGSGRFQRLQVRFYLKLDVITPFGRYYTIKSGIFQENFWERKRAKMGIDLNEQA